MVTGLLRAVEGTGAESPSTVGWAVDVFVAGAVASGVDDHGTASGRKVEVAPKDGLDGGGVFVLTAASGDAAKLVAKMGRDDDGVLAENAANGDGAIPPAKVNAAGDVPVPENGAVISGRAVKEIGDDDIVGDDGSVNGGGIIVMVESLLPASVKCDIRGLQKSWWRE